MYSLLQRIQMNRELKRYRAKSGRVPSTELLPCMDLGVTLETLSTLLLGGFFVGVPVDMQDF
jgi:hypothetical protein